MPLDRVDLSKYLSGVFIETGTHRGDGVRRALEAGFEEVMTCDIDASFLGRIPAKLRDDARVRIGYGSSKHWLTDFCYTAQYKSATFWLDAHPNGDLEYATSPLSYELEVIDAHIEFMNDVTIMVDDMRLFGEEDQDAIELFIEDMRSVVQISRINGHCENDILVGQM